ncbi:membrane-spanning 4-domains subfamily A member 8-like isoform X2 [Brachyhypopomus gauderio]|uniref:membrane-spanning 4-domains subfamily A member 8-like isoform X2 n=1 Tax=Brachyhypopomus gauderio TaxID=698409 RepID=UPI0040426E9E
MSSGAVYAINVGSRFMGVNHGSPTHVSPAVAQLHGASAPPILGIPTVVPDGNMGNVVNVGNVGNVGFQPGRFEKFLKVQPKALGYIIAGSLTVAAENKRHICLLKGSLGMNVVSAVFSGTAIVLFSMDFVVRQVFNCYEMYGSYESYGSESHEECWMFFSRSNGISGVLLLFSLLQFIISICISAFGCRATCCD